MAQATHPVSGFAGCGHLLQGRERVPPGRSTLRRAGIGRPSESAASTKCCRSDSRIRHFLAGSFRRVGCRIQVSNLRLLAESRIGVLNRRRSGLQPKGRLKNIPAAPQPRFQTAFCRQGRVCGASHARGFGICGMRAFVAEQGARAPPGRHTLRRGRHRRPSEKFSDGLFSFDPRQRLQCHPFQHTDTP